MKRTTERYKKVLADNNYGGGVITGANTQHWKQMAANLRHQIEILDTATRQLLGEGITNKNQRELTQLDHKLCKAHAKVRKRKEELLLEEINSAVRQEALLQRQNDHIRAKILESQYNQQTNILLLPPDNDALQAFNFRNFMHVNPMNGAHHLSCHELTALQLG
ncbi:hypothetical protein KI387_002313, partial [Taxus chinensis]